MDACEDVLVEAERTAQELTLRLDACEDVLVEAERTAQELTLRWHATSGVFVGIALLLRVAFLRVLR